jgi:hypothetical protein
MKQRSRVAVILNKGCLLNKTVQKNITGGARGVCFADCQLINGTIRTIIVPNCFEADNRCNNRFPEALAVACNCEN